MRFVVVGAGAMGGLFGAKLWAAGHDVLLLDIWDEHIDVVRRDGITIIEVDGSDATHRVPISRPMPEAAAAADVLLVEVKTYDTVSALEPYRDRLNPNAVVLTLQNGIGNDEALGEALPGHGRIVLGTTAQGSNVVAPGRLQRTGAGPTEIGIARGSRVDRNELHEIADAFSGAGIPMSVVKDVYGAVWAKLSANAAINPITALTGLRNGELPSVAELRHLYVSVIDELTSVMDVLKIPRIKDDYVAHAEFVMEVTATSASSMLQDVRFRRRTEIDAINGAISRLGESHGIATPANAHLTALIHGLERSYLKGDHRRE